MESGCDHAFGQVTEGSWSRFEEPAEMEGVSPWSIGMDGS